MDKIIEAMLSVLLTVLTGIILAGIISANLDASRAKSYHADVIQEIESANMSDNVINSCVSNADNEGYSLSVDKISARLSLHMTIKFQFLMWPHHISAEDIQDRGCY